MIELAKRAVACKHWRWMDGMLGLGDIASDSVRVIKADAATIKSYDMVASTNAIVIDGLKRYNYLPDLTDSATLGCLLQLVLESYPDGIVLSVNDLPIARECEEKSVMIKAHYSDGTCRHSRRSSVAKALVAALEFAE